MEAEEEIVSLGWSCGAMCKLREIKLSKWARLKILEKNVWVELKKLKLKVKLTQFRSIQFSLTRMG